eukprot:TRINITY_DN1817_c0_g1_i1.p2 TRINITY_DN1817_c0_g1~~TRINITY_DN1817_c0_g1_i1.p2  ORF type:complete len:281 (+),score=3.37 TRINITY_DN1817_c0_g1_i1:75-917(+)
MKSGKFNFGQYKGKTYSSILKQDQSYCLWALRQSEPSEGLQSFVDYVSNLGVLDNLKLEFGQYQSKKFSWVYENDPNYCSWVINQKKATLKEMQLFKYYLERKEASEAPKKQKIMHQSSPARATQNQPIPRGYCAEFLEKGQCPLQGCNLIHSFPNITQQQTRQIKQESQQYEAYTLRSEDIIGDQFNQRQSNLVSKSVSMKNRRTSLSKTCRRSGTAKDRILNKIEAKPKRKQTARRGKPHCRGRTSRSITSSVSKESQESSTTGQYGFRPVIKMEYNS